MSLAHRIRHAGLDPVLSGRRRYVISPILIKLTGQQCLRYYSF
ncbi:MAG: hypothetical protein ACJA0C_000263 [Candidatus Endobugula sp.]|jgi:hypothetical protein